MPSMVFISHSSKDRATADTICAHLESAGITCWIAPRDIEPGATWTKGIMQGLDACRVLILSSRSMRMIPIMFSGKWRKLSPPGSPSSLSESRMFCQTKV
jgi:hypothetical protein